MNIIFKDKVTITSSSTPIITYLISINRFRATQRNQETDTSNDLMYHLLSLNTYHYIRKSNNKKKETELSLKCIRCGTTYFYLTNTYHLVLIDINHAAMPHSSLSSILPGLVIYFSCVLQLNMLITYLKSYTL